MKCSIKNCEGISRRKSYCDKHYERWRVHGNPNLIKDRKPTLDIYRKRFKSKMFFYKTNDCITWKGSIRKSGYGAFNYFGKTIGAHRAAYLLFVGEIGNGLMVCHRCDNRSCVNINHLFLGSHQDNMNDMKEKKRHSYGVKNIKNKLNESQIREIKRKLKMNEGAFKISKEFNVSCALICDIKKNKLWKHIT